MSWSSLPQGQRTALAGLVLIATYLGYSWMTRPWLAVPRQKTAAVAPRASDQQAARAADIPAEWFPGDSWVRDAGGRFRDGGRMLFFQEHELFNKNHSIRVSPVALLWQQEKGRAPITATADSAQLDASTEFSFEEGQFGRITSGLLSGIVRINGPDGLRMEGRTFYISDDAMKVWTSQPVKFGWGTHSGEASGGAEIDLLASGDPAQKGLMSVSDVQRIRLRGRVTCDLFFGGPESNEESMRLNVTAANGFDFYVPTHEATFFGFMDRELRPDNQILVTRCTESGGFDRLFCSKLVLQLQPVVSAPQEPDKSARFELTSITAEGKRVIVKSDDHGLDGTLGRLRYHLAERQLELVGRLVTGSDQMQNVTLVQAGRVLSSPLVRIGHDAQNRIHTVECRGAGDITDDAKSDAADPSEQLAVSWSESMTFQQSDRPRVTVRGDAAVTQPDSGLKLTGDQLVVELASFGGDQRDSGTEGPNLGRLEPRELRGTGNVVVESGDLTARATETLLVRFVPAAADAEQADSGVRPVALTADASQTPPAGPSRLADGHTVCSSEMIEMNAATRLRDGRRSVEFSDVWLKGKVAVEHGAMAREQSFSASGNALFAREGFTGSREISLFGDPAVVVNDHNRFEMKRIDLTEIGQSSRPQRDVAGEGSGRVRFVVSRGLDGQELSRPSPLEIYWSERMSFSGQTATFVGSIRAVMNNKMDHDMQLKCSILKVHFADRIRLERNGASDEYRVAGDSASQAGAGNIDRIECLGRVDVDINVLTAGTIVARHHAEFSDLEIHQESGNFHASGPGLIESVQPDSGQQLATPTRASARANTPISAPETSFVYLKATFIGRLEGNRLDRFAELKQHVRGVFGPVRHLEDRLDIDELNAEDLPEKTVLLGCENLTIASIPGRLPGETSFSLVARSNCLEPGAGTRTPCRLESHQFSGDADKITYDHAKQQFIVSAEQGRQARVTHRPDRGAPQNLIGRSFQYNRDRNQLTANQITGVQASDTP